MVDSLGWETFTSQPELPIRPIVREFYANAFEVKEEKAFVRGNLVPFDVSTIKKFYGLKIYLMDEYEIFRVHPNVKQVIGRLTNDQGLWRWKSEFEVTNFLASFLITEARAWHHFISAKVLPSSNLSEVTKERVVLSYDILTKKTIGVGNLINHSIWTAIRTKGNTAFQILGF